MPDILIVLVVVAAFLGIFQWRSVVRNRKLAREDSVEKPAEKKAA